MNELNIKLSIMTFFSFSIVKAAYDRVRFLFRGKIKKPEKVCMYVVCFKKLLTILTRMALELWPFFHESLNV